MNLPLTAACFVVLCALIFISCWLACLYYEEEELLSKEAENTIGGIYV